VLSIALGVGVTTAVYSMVDSNLWRTPVIRDPRNVVVRKTAGAVPTMIHRVRDFEPRDDAASLRVAILFSATAHALFGTSDIIGSGAPGVASGPERRAAAPVTASGLALKTAQSRRRR
jgi:hypothetical protein